MTSLRHWPTWLSWFALAIGLFLTIRADLSHLRWVERLSQEGSPPPARSATSPTGYVNGQRHFLGVQERGETYRWIAATQDLIAAGPYASSVYLGDSAPEGRPQLLPKLYVFWLAAISGALHLFTSDPIGLCVERAALWEPVISHLLAFVAFAVFMGRRGGAPAAAAAGLFVALFPAISGQFLPGVLTPRSGALLLAAYAIAVQFLPSPGKQPPRAFSIRSALAASAALWLDPAFGFPAVLIAIAAGAARTLVQKTSPQPILTWCLVGSGATFAACLIDRNPWSPAVGELRYLHPTYALAWLGLGLALRSGQQARERGRFDRKTVAGFAAGLLFLAPLVYVQFAHGYKGWLYPSAAMSRLTSLDETRFFAHALDWAATASFGEVFFLSVPLLAALVAVALAGLIRRDAAPRLAAPAIVAATLLAGVLALAFIHPRWLIVAALLSLPVVWLSVLGASVLQRRALLAVAAVFLFGLLLWNQNLPASLARPADTAPPAAADLRALVHRHFSHWFAAHADAPRAIALAPPELSDSLVFHAGIRTLMSTAWESHPGQIAASRVLSAPEPTEAEAVLQSREVTHLAIPSWDAVIPLLVREPQDGSRDTFHARLQRWLLPRYLRAVPYHLPRMPGFLDQQLALFKVVFPQDEALSLSRLAEYFVEMNRPEPAGLAAQVLGQSFPEDPNAAIARALVFARLERSADFDREVARLAADVSAGRTMPDWDRRVQRAIVLALARRHDLARGEIEACVAEASENALLELTALEAYRLAALARNYGVSFADPKLAQLLAALGAEYGHGER